jgi:hypothetical protein
VKRFVVEIEVEAHSADVAGSIVARALLTAGWKIPFTHFARSVDVPAMQPIIATYEGIARFRANKIVQWVLRQGKRGRKFDLNDIIVEDFPIEDVEQFWQMLGYSLSGYGELSFIREETIAHADAEAERLGPDRAATVGGKTRARRLR